MTLRLLFIGDVVGEPGRTALYRALPELRAEFEIDVTVVNGENAAGGRGITPGIAQEFFRHGVDVITTGDHVWDQPELIPWMNSERRLLRPLNYQEDTPGYGSTVVETPKGCVGVMQLQGRSFIQPPLENPFILGEKEVLRLRAAGAKAVFVDMHAETTSEKIAMGYNLDGKASAVVGTHTHVQTADNTVLPGGTAYLTDAGMCGPAVGVLGRELQGVLGRFRSTLPAKFPVAGWPVRLCGAAVSIDMETGRSLGIERISRMYTKEG